MADAIGLGISYDMILDALSEAGGVIDTNGRYPVNDVIRRRLRRILINWHQWVIKRLTWKWPIYQRGATKRSPK